MRLCIEPLEDRNLLSTLTVLNNTDSGTGSLRAAIEGAHDGDTILFASQLQGGSTITLSKQLKISKDLDIEGPGPANLTISGNDQTRIFDINKGTVTIAGLTLAHGRADQGGAIFNEVGTSLTLADLMLAANQAVASTFATGGGGALWNGGQATVIHCAFVGNQAPAAPRTGFGIGGAIENSAATLIIMQSSFTGNQVLIEQFGGDGGAIDNTDGHVSIADSTFTNNQAIGTGRGAEAIGGAVFNFDSSLLPGGKNPDPGLATVSLTNCTFTGNKALGGAGGDGITTSSEGLAGAIGNFGGTMLVSNSVVQNNQASGGALAPGAPHTGDTINVGGGLYSRFGIVIVTNSTFSGNQAIGSAGGVGGIGGFASGGAIYGDGATVSITGSAFSCNSAIGGSGGSGAAGGIGDGGAIGLGAGLNGPPNPRHIDANVTISDSTFIDNLAVGGAGGAGARGGDGIGGAISAAVDVLEGDPDASSVTVSHGSFLSNSALGGLGGTVGNGGTGLGGALAVVSGISSVSTSSFSYNLAQGGAGAAGGNGFGGAMYIAGGATLNVSGTTITYNQAEGGGGDPGRGGKGIGGGVYDLGMFTFDVFTLIRKNKATTSNDDVFP